MLEIPKFYNFKANQLIIGGEKIGGFDDDGGIEYELGDSIHRDTSGADSETTVSRVNDARLYATITLKETSAGYRKLFEQLKFQLTSELAIVPLPFIHIDPINGDLVRSAYTIFTDFPTPSKARDAGSREFRVLLPYAAFSMVMGANNQF